MKRVLSLCSLLLLPLAGCDVDTALDVAQAAGEPAIPDPPTPGTPGSDDPCADYCGEYLATCGSEYFGYLSYDECEELCPYWEDLETDENLAAKCRRSALGDIDSENSASIEAGCYDAGPDSDLCGSAYVVTCERYCDLFGSECPTHGAQFESPQKCQAWCDAETLEGAGDTIECRIDQLTSPFAPPRCDDAAANSPTCT
mgnify:CR=1 FL=1